MKSKTMRVKGKANTRQVTIDGAILNPGRSQVVRNHSPDGFSWGYGGSGPAQLALAICLLIMDENAALRHYQQFKDDVVAALTAREDFDVLIAFTWDGSGLQGNNYSWRIAASSVETEESNEE